MLFAENFALDLRRGASRRRSSRRSPRRSAARRRGCSAARGRRRPIQCAGEAARGHVVGVLAPAIAAVSSHFTGGRPCARDPCSPGRARTARPRGARGALRRRRRRRSGRRGAVVAGGLVALARRAGPVCRGDRRLRAAAEDRAEEQRATRRMAGGCHGSRAQVGAGSVLISIIALTSVFLPTDSTSCAGAAGLRLAPTKRNRALRVFHEGISVGCGSSATTDLHKKATKMPGTARVSKRTRAARVSKRTEPRASEAVSKLAGERPQGRKGRKGAGIYRFFRPPCALAPLRSVLRRCRQRADSPHVAIFTRSPTAFHQLSSAGASPPRHRFARRRSLDDSSEAQSPWLVQWPSRPRLGSNLRSRRSDRSTPGCAG